MCNSVDLTDSMSGDKRLSSRLRCTFFPSAAGNVSAEEVS